MGIAIPSNPTGNTCSNSQSTFGSVEYPAVLSMVSTFQIDCPRPHRQEHGDSTVELLHPMGWSSDPSFELQNKTISEPIQSDGNTSVVNSMHDSSLCCCITEYAIRMK